MCWDKVLCIMCLLATLHAGHCKTVQSSDDGNVIELQVISEVTDGRDESPWDLSVESEFVSGHDFDSSDLESVYTREHPKFRTAEFLDRSHDRRSSRSQSMPGMQLQSNVYFSNSNTGSSSKKPKHVHFKLPSEMESKSTGPQTNVNHFGSVFIAAPKQEPQKNIGNVELIFPTKIFDENILPSMSEPSIHKVSPQSKRHTERSASSNLSIEAEHSTVQQSNDENAGFFGWLKSIFYSSTTVSNNSEPTKMHSDTAVLKSPANEENPKPHVKPSGTEKLFEFVEPELPNYSFDNVFPPPIVHSSDKVLINPVAEQTKNIPSSNDNANQDVMLSNGPLHNEKNGPINVTDASETKTNVSDNVHVQHSFNNNTVIYNPPAEKVSCKDESTQVDGTEDIAVPVTKVNDKAAQENDVEAQPAHASEGKPQSVQNNEGKAQPERVKRSKTEMTHDSDSEEIESEEASSEKQKHKRPKIKRAPLRSNDEEDIKSILLVPKSLVNRHKARNHVKTPCINDDYYADPWQHLNRGDVRPLGGNPSSGPIEPVKHVVSDWRGEPFVGGVSSDKVQMPVQETGPFIRQMLPSNIAPPSVNQAPPSVYSAPPSVPNSVPQPQQMQPKQFSPINQTRVKSQEKGDDKKLKVDPKKSSSESEDEGLGNGANGKKLATALIALALGIFALI